MSPDMEDDEALGSMLISWYMSGYHTGYYLVCAQRLADLFWPLKGDLELLFTGSLSSIREKQWAYMAASPLLKLLLFFDTLFAFHQVPPAP